VVSFSIAGASLSKLPIERGGFEKVADESFIMVMVLKKFFLCHVGQNRCFKKSPLRSP